MISAQELRRILRNTSEATIAEFIEPLNAAMKEFDIDNPLREAAFLAQIAHESGGLHYVEELATGEAYEGRADLGNTHPGDGRRFKGRGLIQITGRHNYEKCGEALGVELLRNPELLEEEDLACRSAAWYWQSRGLNELADKQDFKLITKRINGGFNGYKDRCAYYERALDVLGVNLGGGL